MKGTDKKIKDKSCEVQLGTMVHRTLKRTAIPPVLYASVIHFMKKQ